MEFLNGLDEISRVYPAIRVGSRCQGVDVLDTTEGRLMLHPPPTHLQMDTRPEFTTDVLQEWCIDSSSDTTYIDLGSP